MFSTNLVIEPYDSIHSRDLANTILIHKKLKDIKWIKTIVPN